MSIYLSGHWPAHVNRYPSDEDFEQAMDNLDEACYETGSALLNSIDESAGDDDRLWDALERRLARVSRCPITVEDAYGIAQQSIQDTGSPDTQSSAWENYDMYGEGITNHAMYHAGRPYECGGACPSRIVYALDT